MSLSLSRAIVRRCVVALRLTITILLLYYGTLNLAYSIGFQDLLMNAVAMAYVRLCPLSAPYHSRAC